MYRQLICFSTLMMVLCAGISGQDQPERLDSFLNVLEGTFESDSLHARAYEDVILYYIEQTNGTEAFPYLDSVREFSKKSDMVMGSGFMNLIPPITTFVEESMTVYSYTWVKYLPLQIN